MATAAAVASYEPAYDLVGAHGESGWTARMVPLTADGLNYTSSMVMLDSTRNKTPVAGLAGAMAGVQTRLSRPGGRGARWLRVVVNGR